jgi:hypothetical protein
MAISEAFTRILDSLRIHTPGALDDVLKLELFNTADDFLRSTNAWVDEILFETFEGVNEYTLTPTDPPAQVIRLQGCFDQDDLYVVSTMDEPGVVQIDDTVDGKIYTAVVVLSVKDPTDADGLPELPAWIVTKYHDALMHGTLFRLMAQPYKPYSNAALALANARLYASDKAMAKREVLRRNVFRGQPWFFPQQFRVRNKGR